MILEETLEKIKKPSQEAMERCRQHWDSIAKPLHSLGKLEDALVRIAGMTGNERIHLDKKALVVMCADNGVVEEQYLAIPSSTVSGLQQEQSKQPVLKTVRRTSSSYRNCMHIVKKRIRRIPRVTTKNFPLHYLYCKKDSGQTKRTYFRTDCCFLLRSRFFPVIMNWISVTLVLCRPE